MLQQSYWFLIHDYCHYFQTNNLQAGPLWWHMGWHFCLDLHTVKVHFNHSVLKRTTFETANKAIAVFVPFLRFSSDIKTKNVWLLISCPEIHSPLCTTHSHVWYWQQNKVILLCNQNKPWNTNLISLSPLDRKQTN